jgi:hypothetical protein
VRRTGAEKRIVITIHPLCGEDAIGAVRAAVVSVRSVEILVRDSIPESCVSLAFQRQQCHPLIFIEPRDLDAAFFENHEPGSIVLTQHFDRMELKVLASFYGILLLPIVPETISQAVHQVLSENGIIGSGESHKKFGEIWHEMLAMIPGIRGTYAEAIAAAIPSPHAVVHRPPSALTSRSGNRVPDKILERLRMFYSTEDPEARLETPARKRRSTDPP